MRPISILLLLPTCQAQVETSTSIRGLVTDPTGAAVPAGEVAVRNTARPLLDTTSRWE